jgi:hypothetical protein
MIRYVYVAGPISSHPMHRTHDAIKAADALLAVGFAPYVTHTSVVWDMISPKGYEEWMSLDFAWVERCDALVRIPGESKGADREVEHARAKGIPVFFGVEEIIAWSLAKGKAAKS